MPARFVKINFDRQGYIFAGLVGLILIAWCKNSGCSNRILLSIAFENCRIISRHCISRLVFKSACGMHAKCGKHVQRFELDI